VLARERVAPEIALLIQAIDEAYDRRTWHGTNLRGAVRRVSHEEALWRPAPGRHCIWEIVLHCAYYKYVQARVLTGRHGRGLFPRKPSNWPALPRAAGEVPWREDVALMDEYHQVLREAVNGFDSQRLGEGDGRWTFAQHVHGAAFHDLYHAGQIQLLKRLRRTRPKP